MTQLIESARLKELRTRKGLTQNGLAEKAKVNKQTIYRLELRGKHSIRMTTLQKIAEALGVSPEILSGQAPLPERNRPTAGPSDGNNYQISVRVSGAVRNAFSLAVMRYQVPMARIVEVAPFLFVLAAEASLARRRTKLAELEALFDRKESLRSSFPHLPPSLVLNFEATEAVEAEKASICALDILANKLPDNIFDRFPAIEEDYDDSKHNPFVRYLKETGSAAPEVASIDEFCRHSTDFTVCRENALKLACGNEKLANGIAHGWVMLHEMPRELLADDAAERRVEWLTEKADAYLATIPDLNLSLFGDLLTVEKVS